MTITISYNCGCCIPSGDCDFCDTVPTSVELTVGAASWADVEDGTCLTCDDCNNTFTLPAVDGEECAFYLSFEDAGISCYSPSGSPAGFYAEITADEAWHVEVLDGGGSTLAVWDDAPISESGCCDSHSSTPFGEGPDLGATGFAKVNTLRANTFGARTFGVDQEATVDGTCDWSEAEISLAPQCP